MELPRTNDPITRDLAAHASRKALTCVDDVAKMTPTDAQAFAVAFAAACALTGYAVAALCSVNGRATTPEACSEALEAMLVKNRQAVLAACEIFARAKAG